MKTRILGRLVLLITTAIIALALPITHAQAFVKITHVLSTSFQIPTEGKILYVGIVEHYNKPYTFVTIGTSSSILVNVILPNGTVRNVSISNPLCSGKSLHELDFAVGTFNNTPALVVYCGNTLYVITSNLREYRNSTPSCYSVVLADVDNDGVPEIILGCTRGITILKFTNNKLQKVSFSMSGTLGTYVFLVGVSYVDGVHIYGISCGGYPVNCRPLWLAVSSKSGRIYLRAYQGPVVYEVHYVTLGEPHASMFVVSSGGKAYLVVLHVLRKVVDNVVEANVSVVEVAQGTFRVVKNYEVKYIKSVRYCDWSIYAQHGLLYNNSYIVFVNESQIVLVQALTGNVTNVISLSFNVSNVAQNGLACAGSYCGVVLLDKDNVTHIVFLNGTSAVVGAKSSLVYTFGPYIAVMNIYGSEARLDLYKLVLYVPTVHKVSTKVITRRAPVSVLPVPLKPATAPVPITQLVFKHVITSSIVRKTLGELVYVSRAASVAYGFPVKIVVRFSNGSLTIPKGTVPLKNGRPTYVTSIRVVRVNTTVPVGNVSLLSPVYNITTAPAVTSFSKPLLLKLYVRKIIRGMYVLYFNRTLRKWIPLPTLFSYNGTVVTYVKHTGLYAVGLWRPAQVRPVIDVSYSPIVTACSNEILHIHISFRNKPIRGLVVRIYVNGAYRYYCITSSNGNCSVVLRTCRIGIYTILVKAGLASRSITLWVYPKIDMNNTSSTSLRWVTW